MAVPEEQSTREPQVRAAGAFRHAPLTLTLTQEALTRV
jgi:hypothetical protein